jgi:hypothetical protein
MNEEEIRNAGFPMKRQTWLLQTMLLEPHRICDPAELAAWKEGRKPAESLDRAAATKRDSYGLTGKRTRHKLRKATVPKCDRRNGK